MTNGSTDYSPIRATPDSEVARWARARSRGRPAPIEAVEAEGRPRTLFVADQVLVDRGDAGLVDHLIERHGAELIPRKPLPPPPEGMGPNPNVDVDGMPTPILLRIKDPPPPTARAADLLGAAFSGAVSVTSERAAALAGLVAELAGDGRGIGLNTFSTASALPLVNPVDWTPLNPLATKAFLAPYRVAAAWHLIEAFREFRSAKPVTVAILDSGFWLDGFAPAIAPSQIASDLGASVAQLNLLDEGVPAGGASGLPNGDGFDAPWHGNASASVATARVGNNQGAAGVGGTVATPVLLKTDGSLDYYFRCLHVCLAWGIDVLSMSITHTEDAEFWFPTTAWDNNFRYASEAGLIMVAAAGNNYARIPEDQNIRPATRTPGMITVGALDQPKDGVEVAKDYSNHGSSITIWAPTDVWAMPDDNNPMGKPFGGTSCAAPFVSGVVAMMRAVAPIGTLAPDRAKQLLQDSGWRGTGKVGIGLDAYAAVLAAMGGRLPDEEAESHATPQTARLLKPGPGGALMPFRLRSDPRRDVLSSSTHSNWYRFETDGFSRLDLQVRFYPLLGAVSVTLEPDDELALANAEIVTTGGVATGVVRLTGLIAPGAYKVFVRGAINLYELELRLTDADLPADMFEPNESFDTATRFRLLDAPEPLAVLSRDNAGGVYDLSIHKAGDRDVFRVEPVPTNPLNIPMLKLAQTDLPLDVTIFDAAGVVIGGEDGTRAAKFILPRDTVSFVQITAARPTRYRMTLRLEVDAAQLPGPLQEEPAVPVPDPGDPPFRVDDGMSHVVFQADELQQLGVLRLADTEGQALKVELLDPSGAVVRTADRHDDGRKVSTVLDVSDLAPGVHVVRIGHAEARPGLSVPPLNVQRLPSFG